MSCNNRIIQGSNEPLVVQIEGIEAFRMLSFSLFNSLRVRKKHWMVDDVQIDGNIITCPLTETETLALEEGNYLFEMKFVDDSGSIVFAEPITITVVKRYDTTNFEGVE